MAVRVTIPIHKVVGRELGESGSTKKQKEALIESERLLQKETLPQRKVLPEKENLSKMETLPENGVVIYDTTSESDDASSHATTPVVERMMSVDLPSAKFEKLVDATGNELIRDDDDFVNFNEDVNVAVLSKATSRESYKKERSEASKSRNVLSTITSEQGKPEIVTEWGDRTYGVVDTRGKQGKSSEEALRKQSPIVGKSNEEVIHKDSPVVTKIFANTEVRLRAKKPVVKSITSSCLMTSSTLMTSSSQSDHVTSSSSELSLEQGDGCTLGVPLVKEAEEESLAKDKLEIVLEQQANDLREVSKGGDVAVENGGTIVENRESDSSLYTARSSASSLYSMQSDDVANSARPTNMTERQRKRLYRIGLSLFNKKPDKGMAYLIEKQFSDGHPKNVAKFLMTRKGLSRQMIGEFLGNLQNSFNMEVLQYFTQEVDFAGLEIDMALRKFQSYFRMPGEAQRIERLMQVFSTCYCQCNAERVQSFRSGADAVFLLSFAIIMLNTDLHNRNIKPESKMKATDFVKNLRGLDCGENIDGELLAGIYERVRAVEFKPNSDHVTQVAKVEAMILGKKPQLVVSHRRLVCFCRLFEIHDPKKREKLTLHQREVFLFNDLLVILKILNKKSDTLTYTYRQSYSLYGMQVYLFETSHYKYGIRLMTNVDNKVLATFNARSESDREKMVEDLKEAILEVNEMETMRIEEELRKHKFSNHHNHHLAPHHAMTRFSKDSGVVDMDGGLMRLATTDPAMNRLSAPECRDTQGNRCSSMGDLAGEVTMQREGSGSGSSINSGLMLTTICGLDKVCNGVATNNNAK